MRIAVVLGGTALAAVGMSRMDVRSAIAETSLFAWPTVLILLAAAFAQALALATRLWSVFPRGSRPSWPHIARGFGFGQFANCWLPGRAGEVVKVLAVSSRQGEDRSSAVHATGVILVDKAIDVVTLGALIIAFAPLVLASLAVGLAHALPFGAGAAVLLLVATLGIRRFWPSLTGKLTMGLASVRSAAFALFTPSRLAFALSLGCAAWLCEASSLVLASAPLGAHLSMGQAIVALLVLNLGIAVPVSVANVGAYEAAAVAGLTRFGVAVPQALAIAAIHHVAQIAAATIFAFAFWLRDRIAVGVARGSNASPDADALRT